MIERGWRHLLPIIAAGQRQMMQQSGAGAMRAFAFQAFDQRGGFRRDGAQLAAARGAVWE